MKCTINNKREITGFWEDNLAPKDAVDCNIVKPYHATGTPENEIYIYKLSDNGVVSPTDVGIDFETKQYQRDRETSYPEIREQLDLLYHDMTAGKGDKTGEWYKAVNKVKTDNPKPE